MYIHDHIPGIRVGIYRSILLAPLRLGGAVVQFPETKGDEWYITEGEVSGALELLYATVARSGAFRGGRWR